MVREDIAELVRSLCTLISAPSVISPGDSQSRQHHLILSDESHTGECWEHSILKWRQSDMVSPEFDKPIPEACYDHTDSLRKSQSMLFEFRLVADAALPG